MPDGDDYGRLGVVLHKLHLDLIADGTVCAVGVNLAHLFGPKLCPFCAPLCEPRHKEDPGSGGAGSRVEWKAPTDGRAGVCYRVTAPAGNWRRGNSRPPLAGGLKSMSRSGGDRPQRKATGRDPLMAPGVEGLGRLTSEAGYGSSGEG